MEERLNDLKLFITHRAAQSDFVHHKWFTRWHLEVVESLARDLVVFYPEADKDIIIAMCWMHDYGKIIDFDNQYDHKYIEEGRQEMIKLGFDEFFATTVTENIKTLDQKDNLVNANIETRIVSSVDGCSHLVGPFLSLYWWENPKTPFEDIMRENVRKLTVDWDLKVVLPEAKAAYQTLHDNAMDRAIGKILKIQ